MLTKYRPSGGLAFSGKFVIGVVLVLVAAAVLGAVYQVAMHWIPIIYLEALMVVGMCFVTAMIVGMLTSATHCRNRFAGAAVGLMAGVVAVSVGHFVEYRLQRSAIIAAQPAADRAQAAAWLDFPRYIQLRADEGWTIGRVGRSSASKPTVSGVFVYILWGIEALVIIGAGAVGGFSSASEPYCEGCGKWANFDMLTLKVPEPSAETVAGAKSATSIATLIPSPSAMIAPPPPPPPPTPDIPLDPAAAKKQAKALAKAEAAAAKAPKTSSCLRYSVKSCPECKMLHTLKVDHEVVTVKAGKTEKKTDTLHESIVMSSEEVGALAQLKS